MPEGEYKPEETEKKWQRRWVEDETYEYDREDVEDADTVYSIDTPPPTVSGSLHMGHLYGHTLQDFVARYRRMADSDVFFPFGYDDNGIASERLTEDELGIRHQDFERREFQEKCREVCEEYEEEFTQKMQDLGVSIDWNQTYKTIEPRVQRISQLSFIELYEEGKEYRKKAPAIWCPDCETAISQVEMEDAERHSHFNDIEFPLAGEDGSITISTTRPELLPACVAVFVHPEDDENQDLVGKEAIVPLFEQKVPILEDERVDMEKGSGIVMCCTFGDQTDIEWYQAHDLPLRIAIDESGTMTQRAGEYEGMSTKEAREAIAEDLDEEGYLLDRWEITHTVSVHERCEEDIEFLVTEQWYVEILDNKEKYLEAGKEMDWYPEKMFTRYKHWIDGLQWDWCISRQRDSGIPFPVWYCDECDEVVVAEREQLPADPLSDSPPVENCPECGHDEFVPEDDVFDTWATSSLTPLINAGWQGDNEFERPELYPSSMRPQGHDIISFWLFHTVVKCVEHTGEVPFDSVMINGHVLDKNREKMSKSKGNVVTPEEVLDNYPVDAARYWAAGTSVGDDFPFKDKELVSGEKLMTKLWNASKLVDSLSSERVDSLEISDGIDESELEEIDRWILKRTDEIIESLTEKMDNIEFAKAMDELRSFFWNSFCDDYLEITKQRLHETESESTEYALRHTHRTILKLFAPFLCHITEEIWQEMYSGSSDKESIHLADWPEPLGIEADTEAGETAMEVISALRRYKSENQLPLNHELGEVEIYGEIDGFEDAIKEVMHIKSLTKLEEEPETTKEITDIDLDYSKVGPEFGNKVSEIEEGIQKGEYEISDGELHVAGVELGEDMFETEETVTYAGEGEMLETEKAYLIKK